MANINENALVRGARGSFGKQYVYRKRGDDTHIVRMPSVRKNRELNEKETQVRTDFKLGILYAKGAISSPALKKEYAAKAPKNGTAFNMAFRDYFVAPKVTEIDSSAYNGNAGSTIAVAVFDDFRVVSLKVSIRTAAGALLEEGEATLNPINHSQWDYIAKQANPTIAGCTIHVTAKDLPGNQAVLELTL